MNRIDLTGKRFSRLTVTSYAGTVKSTATWNCICDCGNSIVARYGNLKSGHTKSCGCLLTERIKSHGMHGSPTYVCWDAMIQRCRTTKNKRLVLDYSSRGITVCDEWLDFKNFLRDMGERPDGTSIDRIDNDKGYFPGNCRWATSKEQARNKRSNVFLTINGIKKCVTDWSKEAGISLSTLKYRMKRGWPENRLLSK